jgi:hypothetical protein
LRPVPFSGLPTDTAAPGGHAGTRLAIQERTCGAREFSDVVRGLREGVGSIVSVAIVLMVLVSMDPRVKTRVADLFHDPVAGGMTAGSRLGELGQALWLAARDQSVEHAPLVVFFAAGAVLVLFMLRS